MTCAPSEDSDQPGHLPNLITVFFVHMKKSQVFSYPSYSFVQRQCHFVLRETPDSVISYFERPQTVSFHTSRDSRQCHFVLRETPDSVISYFSRLQTVSFRTSRDSRQCHFILRETPDSVISYFERLQTVSFHTSRDSRQCHFILRETPDSALDIMSVEAAAILQNDHSPE